MPLTRRLRNPQRQRRTPKRSCRKAQNARLLLRIGRRLGTGTGFRPNAYKDPLTVFQIADPARETWPKAKVGDHIRIHAMLLDQPRTVRPICAQLRRRRNTAAARALEPSARYLHDRVLPRADRRPPAYTQGTRLRHRLIVGAVQLAPGPAPAPHAFYTCLGSFCN
jgi:hypothetical protein